MKLLKVIPKIFYADIQHGLKLFVDGLGFEITYQDNDTFYLVEKDEVILQLVKDAEFAAKDRPEIRIETDDIDALFREVSNRAPDLLHPNLKQVKIQPWGLKEFALKDPSDVCVIIQQPLDS